jgi:hypothetical protein
MAQLEEHVAYWRRQGGARAPASAPKRREGKKKTR